MIVYWFGGTDKWRSSLAVVSRRGQSCVSFSYALAKGESWWLPSYSFTLHFLWYRPMTLVLCHTYSGTGTSFLVCLVFFSEQWISHGQRRLFGTAAGWGGRSSGHPGPCSTYLSHINTMTKNLLVTTYSYRAECGQWRHCKRDVLSHALFPTRNKEHIQVRST